MLLSDSCYRIDTIISMQGSLTLNLSVISTLHSLLQTRSGVGKLFSERAALLCPNFERAGMCVRLLMQHVF